MAPLPRNALSTLLDDALVDFPPGRRVWVALSGGLDSSLLLTLAAEACQRADTPMAAIHVNHGLQDAAASFEQHCEALCQRLKVPLKVVRVTCDIDHGKGVEAAAREARYAAFADHLPPGDVLWLAQHQDDQAETLLLAALRGSGLRGLAAMPQKRQSRHLTLVRPWLTVDQQALRQVAESLHLDWVDDPTNAQCDADRNFLRHRVLPVLETRWASVRKQLANVASRAAEADTLLTDYALEELATIRTRQGLLDVAALQKRPLARQRLLVRTECQRLGLPTPPARRLENLLKQFTAAYDAQVEVTWPGAEARIWQKTLYLQGRTECIEEGTEKSTRESTRESTGKSIDHQWHSRWNGEAPLETPLGVLSLSIMAEHSDLSAGTLNVTWRRGGEKLTLAKRGRRDLKRLLQEARLPPWERDRVVVVWWVPEKDERQDERQGERQECVAAFHPPTGYYWVAAGWTVLRR
ncbi:tRNA lysidine(34) synthetase TilS [Halomonas sp. LS-001]